MSGIREIFIKNLRFYRNQKGMTQLTLSIELEKGVNYISSIENGIIFPPPETIDKIAEILSIKAVKLFDENASPDNIISNKPNEFSEYVITELEKRISKVIRNEVEKVIGI